MDLPEPTSLDASLTHITAGVNRLRQETGGPVALLGASIGANLALNQAARDPQLAAVVLLSPGLDYRGITAREPLAALNDCPVLILAAEGDAYAAMSSRELKEAAQGFVELHEYRGSTHGTDLLDASGEAREQVFLWLDQVVGPGAAPPADEPSTG
jgi:pimeloyl-ACP methyl ester carboxylesterase